MSTNCWNFFAPSGARRMEMRPGLPAEHSYRTGELRYHVPVRTGHWGYDVRLSTNDLVETMSDGLRRVSQADIAYADSTTLPQEAGDELVPCTEDSDVTLLFVESEPDVLSCSQQSRPHFVKCTTWIGADGPGLKVQSGRHQSSFKKQLFCLRKGEFILFFDASKEVTKITAGAFGEQPMCVRATNGEVANYVLGEAKKRGTNPDSRAWCFYALNELGCQKQLDEFTQMFPDFHRK